MSRTNYYDYLLATIPVGLHNDILRLLVNTDREHRITRDGLVNELKVNDRQIRDVIADLVTVYHIPVLSESGLPGYWLASSEAEKQECILELSSRIRQLQDRRDALRQAKAPAEIPDPLLELKLQPSLWR